MSVTLNGTIRKDIGKGSSRKARVGGLLPAVLYGLKDNISLTVNPKALSKIIKQKGKNSVIELVLEQDSVKSRKVLLKEYQTHPLKVDWVHADFIEVDLAKKIRVHVPVRLTGSSIGEKQGGIVHHAVKTMDVECLPMEIPEYFEVSIDHLNLGEAVHLSDLGIAEKFKVFLPLSATVASVRMEKREELKAAPVAGAVAADGTAPAPGVAPAPGAAPAGADTKGKDAKGKDVKGK